jgi:hypothetical protein
MTIANDPEPAPTADYLWRVLREYICVAFNLFGAPLELARRVWITRKEHRSICDALRPLEMMLRRLVFLDALEFALPDMPVLAAPRVRSPRLRQDRFNLDTSETWRVSFDLDMERGRPRPRVSVNLGQSRARTPALHKLPNAVSSAPLALRLEALTRGFNDPAPLVKRMARLLARDRARQHTLMADLPKRDRAKPFFAQAALTVTLAREKFQSWLMARLDAPHDSS